MKSRLLDCSVIFTEKCKYQRFVRVYNLKPCLNFISGEKRYFISLLGYLSDNELV